MSIGRETPEPGGPGRARPAREPLQMTEAEKRAAQWEARHDVAARGHRAGPETLQRYFAHERVVHAEQPHPSGVHAAPEAHRPVPPAAQPRRPWLRRMLRRMLRRRD